MRLGFIGLGHMGAPIARNLLKAGHSLTVYNRTRARAEDLAREGARVAGSPAEAARDAVVVITMLADDQAVEEAVQGKGGVLAALPAGAVHMCMSTISVALSERLAAAHEKEGQGYVSAPVFGRPEAAAAAKLWVVVAGPREAVERCLPLLGAVAQGVHRLGELAPQANLIKLTGNLLIVSIIEALGEAFALARKSGVAPKELQQVLQPMFGGSPILARYLSIITEGAYEPPGFALRLGLKDVRLVREAADAVAAPLPLAGLVHDNFLAAISHGLADADWSAIALASAERAGLPAK